MGGGNFDEFHKVLAEQAIMQNPEMSLGKREQIQRFGGLETDTQMAATEDKRKKRTSSFQTPGGASGASVLNVGQRDTYFGN